MASNRSLWALFLSSKCSCLQIYPADTRKHICGWIGLAYKKLGRLDNLGPRPLGFRP